MKLSIFIAVFFSSMLGAEIFGLSINKLALFPLLLISGIYFFAGRRIKRSYTKLQIKLILFYLFTIISCLFALFNNSGLDNYDNSLFNYLIQILVFYIPLVIFFEANENQKSIYETFVNSLIITSRIHCIWALLQFFTYYVWNLDFNNYIFSVLLKGFLGENWTSFSYEAGSLVIRITGLNSDSAFLAIIMLIGFNLDKKYIFKILYLIACMFSLSRAGILSFVFLGVYWLIKKSNQKINFKKFIKITIVSLMILFIFIFIYNNNKYINHQVDYMVFRLFNIFETDALISTTRHIMYIPYSLYSWFSDLNIIEKLVGVGPRISGTVFAMNPDIATSLNLSNKTLFGVWTIECDIAELILGYGIIGFTLYYNMIFNIYRIGKKEIKSLFLGIVIFGIMYNVSSMTLIQLIFIIFFYSISKTKEDMNIETMDS